MRVIQLLILILVMVVLTDARLINKHGKCKSCKIYNRREKIKLKEWRTSRAQALNERRVERQKFWTSFYATSTALVREVLVNGKYVLAYIFNATT